ncbi:hypothetical protein TNCV_1024261 [Trichonephila clavipes]|nr:hypothetical protein TNCV_1024261 [Trichonephila clavipes]
MRERCINFANQARGEKEKKKREITFFAGALKAQTVLKTKQNVEFRCGFAGIPLKVTNLFKTNFDIVANLKTRGASDKSKRHFRADLSYVIPSLSRCNSSTQRGGVLDDSEQ